MHPQLLPDQAGEPKDYLWRDGVQYWSMPELARLRGTSEAAARAWAKRNKQHAIREGKHTYARHIIPYPGRLTIRRD